MHLTSLEVLASLHARVLLTLLNVGYRLIRNLSCDITGNLKKNYIKFSKCYLNVSINLKFVSYKKLYQNNVI